MGHSRRCIWASQLAIKFTIVPPARSDISCHTCHTHLPQHRQHACQAEAIRRDLAKLADAHPFLPHQVVREQHAPGLLIDGGHALAAQRFALFEQLCFQLVIAQLNREATGVEVDDLARGVFRRGW